MVDRRRREQRHDQRDDRQVDSFHCEDRPSFPMLQSKEPGDVVYDERTDPRRRHPYADRDPDPFRAAQLCVGGRHRRHTGNGEEVERHERERGCGGKTRDERQAEGSGGFFVFERK